MRFKILIFILTMIASLQAGAAIVITPAAPTDTQFTTISVQNHFGSQADVTSATITRNGNAFTIHQNVDRACGLPSDPLVASSFQVGPLAPGTYTVTATITFVGFPSPMCDTPSLTQTSSFLVSPSVPAFDERLLVLLVASLALGAIVRLRS